MGTVTERLRSEAALARETRSNQNRFDQSEKHGVRIATGCDRLLLKVSETESERRSAFGLVHEAYERAGLSKTCSGGMRVLKHHLLSTTNVLIAKRGTEVVSTATLVHDGLLGVPMESLFIDEIDSMRRAGLRIAEVSCVASQTDGMDKRSRFEMFVQMLGLTAQAARRRRVDRLVLAVHPRHAKVYERLFGCKIESDVRSYDCVDGNPAVLCTHDFEALDKTGYPLIDAIYGTSYPSWQLDGARISTREARRLTRYVLSETEHRQMITA